MIYLDSAATSYYRPIEVADAVHEAIMKLGNPGRGSYNCSMSAVRMLYDTRVMLSDLFGAGNPNSVAFTYNVTHSLNIAIAGLCKEGTRALTTAMEHNSVLRPLYKAQKQGTNLSILPLDEQGRIDYDMLDSRLEQGVDIFVCTHASNVTGNVNDIYKIGEICRKYGTIFVLDAAQTAGLIEINMEMANIAVLCFTGHKSLLGPQGTGGICVSDQIFMPPYMCGGSGIRSFDREQPLSMPESIEAGTTNAHGVAGLKAGLQYITHKGISTIHDREVALARRFIERIEHLKNIKIYGDWSSDENRVGIVALNIGDYPSFEIADALSYKYDIMVRAGVHCAPLLHKSMGTERQGMLRFSFSHFLSDEEVDQAADALCEIYEELYTG